MAVIRGTNGNDTLVGGNGNDTLGGRRGSDSLDGGAGNDLLFVTGDGSDTVIGGAGIDTLAADYFFGVVATSGIVMTYDTATGNGTVSGGGVSTIFSGIEAFNITGSDYADTLMGGTGNDALYGFSGNDSLDGGAGDDSLGVDGNGSDTIIGGVGIDTLAFGDLSATSSIVMTYDTATGNGTAAGGGVSIAFSGIEAFYINGSRYADTLVGGTGNDSINDYYGNNSLDGGAGDDLFSINGDGRNTVIGGVGIDTLESFYLDATSGIVMTYDGLTGNGTVSRGGVLTTFSGIEAFNIIGSNYADTLIGGTGNDSLNGFSGNDSLDGGMGNDSLNGSDGNDRFSIDGRGRDSVDGSIGGDTLSADYSKAIGGIGMTYDSVSGNGTVTGSNVSTTISGIEVFNIVGSRYADTLVGGANRDILAGGNGNDVIDSGAGNDILYGNRGHDSLNGGDGNDLLIGARQPIFGVGTIDTLMGGRGADTFVLGFTTGVSYDDGNNATAGLSDYALITDFSVSEDIIRLKSGLSYVLGSSPRSLGISGTGIFIDNDGVAGLSANDELVGVLKGVTLTPGAITTSTPGFAFV